MCSEVSVFPPTEADTWKESKMTDDSIDESMFESININKRDDEEEEEDLFKSAIDVSMVWLSE